MLSGAALEVLFQNLSGPALWWNRRTQAVDASFASATRVLLLVVLFYLLFIGSALRGVLGGPPKVAAP